MPNFSIAHNFLHGSISDAIDNDILPVDRVATQRQTIRKIPDVKSPQLSFFHMDTPHHLLSVFPFKDPTAGIRKTQERAIGTIRLPAMTNEIDGNHLGKFKHEFAGFVLCRNAWDGSSSNPPWRCTLIHKTPFLIVHALWEMLHDDEQR
jgi:hypothetical protein